jgi:NADPH:quinone reductase-like Zn-dependent oxidoreductase
MDDKAPQLPARLGYEAAAVVDAVGPGVDKSWLGKQVSTIPSFSMNAYGVFGVRSVTVQQRNKAMLALVTPVPGRSAESYQGI